MKTINHKNGVIKVTGYKPLFAFKHTVNFLKSNGWTISVSEAETTQSKYIVADNEDETKMIQVRFSDHTSPSNVIVKGSDLNKIGIYDHKSLMLLDGEVVNADGYKVFKEKMIQFVKS
jgi:hypothetical protein